MVVIKNSANSLSEEENPCDLHARKEEEIIICCGIVVSEWIHLKRVLNLMNKMYVCGGEHRERERRGSGILHSVWSHDCKLYILINPLVLVTMTAFPNYWLRAAIHQRHVLANRIKWAGFFSYPLLFLSYSVAIFTPRIQIRKHSIFVYFQTNETEVEKAVMLPISFAHTHPHKHKR